MADKTVRNLNAFAAPFFGVQSCVSQPEHKAAIVISFKGEIE